MHELPGTGLLRLQQIIGQKPVSAAEAAENKARGRGIRRARAGTTAIIPVSASTWWEGVRSGRYPAPVKLGGITAWRAEDIRRLLEEVTPCA